MRRLSSMRQYMKVKAAYDAGNKGGSEEEEEED